MEIEILDRGGVTTVRLSGNLGGDTDFSRIQALTDDETLAQSTMVGLQTWAGQIRAGLTPAPKSS